MIRKYAEIFCWKNVSSFCTAKATHIFSAKNFSILHIESAKTVHEMAFKELVKLTTLWTTGRWFSDCNESNLENKYRQNVNAGTQESYSHEAQPSLVIERSRIVRYEVFYLIAHDSNIWNQRCLLLLIFISFMMLHCHWNRSCFLSMCISRILESTSFYKTITFPSFSTRFKTDMLSNTEEAIILNYCFSYFGQWPCLPMRSMALFHLVLFQSTHR